MPLFQWGVKYNPLPCGQTQALQTELSAGPRFVANPVQGFIGESPKMAFSGPGMGLLKILHPGDR